MKSLQSVPRDIGDVPVVDYGRPRPYIVADGFNLAVLDPARWSHRGLCVEQPTSMWFAMPNSRRAARALRACALCPVRDECLATSLVYGDEFGIWGGLTADAREPLTRRLRDGEPLTVVLAAARTTRRGAA